MDFEVLKRRGIGFDAHQLIEGRKLILGGVEIPYNKGTLGYSDGDALTHVICDALLGAANLGDLGEHFPETPDLKDISSLVLLSRVYELVRQANFQVNYVDSIVILQAPKLTPYKQSIKEKLSGVLSLLMDNISVKATTTDSLGIIGSGDGVAAMSVVQLSKF